MCVNGGMPGRNLVRLRFQKQFSFYENSARQCKVVSGRFLQIQAAMRTLSLYMKTHVSQFFLKCCFARKREVYV